LISATIEVVVPSVFQSSFPLAAVVALKNTAALKNVKSAGPDDAAPLSMSIRTTVPLRLPSLIHGSIPAAAVMARNTARPDSAVIAEGEELAAPALMSFRRNGGAPPALTVCEIVVDDDALKFPSPEYAASIECSPDPSADVVQPADPPMRGTLLHSGVPASWNVTVPAGDPAPGAVTETFAVNVTL
jgi:hypothetical protein